MTNFIPIFPLDIVAYPDEILPLHIFEPRYKQMIRECIEHQKPFGIPTVIEKKIAEYGTQMNILSLEKTFDNGEMDIRIQGMRVFRILEVIREIPEKLYSGAIVNYLENNRKGSPAVMNRLVKQVRVLHGILKLEKEFSKNDKELTSYDIAHHAGLSVQQEYDLLCLMQELQRQEYLKRHLKKVIPIMSEIELLKERIKLNGHFKSLSIDNF
jgi:Lon protease-like protein